ncbi:unnamed protein product [Gulo gulo]|uniref:Uncharacterized protein n=1 Tax=Gulo gulo TaxID=48420 RepID=A0A9X9Q5X9_GULGU|nr:unnamed protein product [Gulo gulo]
MKQFYIFGFVSFLAHEGRIHDPKCPNLEQNLLTRSKV